MVIRILCRTRLGNKLVAASRASAILFQPGSDAGGMERMFAGQSDDQLFVRVVSLQGELILADCAILFKKGC